MKRLFTIIIVLATGFVACKKAKGPANAPSNQQNNNRDSTVHISASINGLTWHTDSAYGYFVKYSGNDSSMINLAITATQYTDVISSINFNITHYTGPGVYPVNPPVNTAIYYIGNERHFGTQGTIIVATDTGYALRGTFTFKADTISITNGEFDVAHP